MSQIIQFRDLLEYRRTKARVLILGSYRTLESLRVRKDSCRKRLKKLKTFLKTKGFEQTRLVEDWIDEKGIPAESYDEHFLKKSFHYIDNWAEILVFVFSRDADNISVTREWSHMIESSRQKCSRSVIVRHEKLNLGSLIRGDIGLERIREYAFKDEKELHEAAFSGCFNILYSLESSKQSKQ